MEQTRIAQRAASAVVVVATAFAAAIAPGCKDQKSGAEKLAEQMAASNAAASASQSASVAAPDPNEQRFATVLKASRERALAYMSVYQAVEKSSGAKADVEKLRAFFANGDKAADKAVEDATFQGKQGVPMTDFEVQSNDCDMKTSTCSASIWEKQSQRGKFVCFSYKLTFSIVGDALYWKDKSIPLMVPCEQK
jgi:hypothetical protein